jgi:hypothetical protein
MPHTVSIDFDFSSLDAASVVVPNPEDVASYLSLYPHLAAVLPEVCDDVRAAMGGGVELSLEVYRDPEIDHSFLALFVRQEHYDGSIMDRIEAARAPLEDRLAGDGCLLVTTDFCRPKYV